MISLSIHDLSGMQLSILWFRSPTTDLQVPSIRYHDSAGQHVDFYPTRESAREWIRVFSEVLAGYDELAGVASEPAKEALTLDDPVTMEELEEARHEILA